jgi:hypothetical protein
MTSIALGAFVVAIIYVMIWSIKNDGVRSISEQTGFIKMRDLSKNVARFSKTGRQELQVAEDALPPEVPREPRPPKRLKRAKTTRPKNR